MLGCLYWSQQQSPPLDLLEAAHGLSPVGFGVGGDPSVLLAFGCCTPGSQTWPRAGYLHCREILSWCRARCQVEFTSTATMGSYGVQPQQSSSGVSRLLLDRWCGQVWSIPGQTSCGLSVVLGTVWSLRGTWLCWCQPAAIQEIPPGTIAVPLLS